LPLDLRVLERGSAVAVGYCTKILADAGSQVVRVEAPGGDHERSASPELFEFLHASKRSVHEAGSELLAAADIVVTGEPVDIDGFRADHPQVVLVTISPFGTGGPWAARPATEFTLQAVCGSTGRRGLRQQPPLAAGGRLGEWITGGYAAVAALAAALEARRSGEGEHVDVAYLDCMTLAMSTYSTVFTSFAGRPAPPGTPRSIETPSIEPCADGYVVYTTNSAQQFADFVSMIGRPEWADDPAWTSVFSRLARRREFLEAVHAYTLPRRAGELLETAALLRIPCSPVLDGEGVEANEHFRDREVLVPAHSGRFRQPRVPYRIGDRPRPVPGRLAAAGEHQGQTGWAARARVSGEAGGWRLPLEGYRVIDCTAWWAGPAATAMLANLGADVVKVESTQRVDQMRLKGTRSPNDDLWWEWGAIYHGANINKRGVTIDLSSPAGRQALVDIVASADLLVENYSARVMDNLDLGWEVVHGVNPSLVMVRMPAFGLDGPWRDRTGFAQTMESVSGMAWLTGWPDGPPVLPGGACDPLAAMHAVFAAILGLAERDGTGGGTSTGVLVECPMVEPALNAAAEQLVVGSASITAGHPHPSTAGHPHPGTQAQRMGNRSPLDAPQGVFQCTGEDRWVAISVATHQQWEALAATLCQDEWASDPDLRNPADRRRRHDQLDAVISAWCAGRTPEEVTEDLAAAGVPAAVVATPEEIAANPQLAHRGFFEVEDHPVTGRHLMPVAPFRFSRVDGWLRRPSPTLGQHTEEVLAGVGYDSATLAELAAEGVIGTRPRF
jgi:crotonobetainyl-CoA:carnitine CoA-transferase CaiB-like acyl-CoA transferase